MAEIRPFRAVMPVPTRAAQVAAPPYDVVSRSEAVALVQGNPCSFLRVSRAEIDLPLTTSPHAEEVYRQASETYRQLCREVPLRPDPAPAFYVYAQEMNGHAQAGIVATLAVDEYDDGTIRKHERTRQDKEDDRTRHILALRSQTGPVFLIYPDVREIDGLVAAVQAGPARFDFRAADGIRHTGWRVSDERIPALAAAFRRVPRLYIADGHHRAASASRARAAVRAADPSLTGDAACNWFLGVVFPAGQMRILPYNRMVRTLNGMSAKMFMDRLRDCCQLTADVSPEPAQPGSVHMFLGGRWWQLRFARAAAASPVDALDVSVLQRQVLGPLLGIDDPRTSPEIEFSGGIRGSSELEQRVKSGEAAVAFSMYPTQVAELMTIADAGEMMPPKSTWFEPKLRDGLFIHDI